MTFVAHFLNGTRRSSEDARCTYNNHVEARSATTNTEEEKKVAQQSPDLPAHGQLTTYLLSDQSNAMCIMASSLCDAREPVCLHENTPGELAPLKLIRPGGFVSIWSARSLHFSWNGARLWLALEKSTSEAVS